MAVYAEKNLVYFIDYNNKSIDAYSTKFNKGAFLRRNKLEKQPNCLLIVRNAQPDGLDTIFIGEDDGVIDVATLESGGRLKFKSKINLPENSESKRVSQLLRIDEGHILAVNPNRYIHVINLATLSVDASFEIPEYKLDNDSDPVTIEIRDATILDTADGKLTIALALENLGI